MSAPAINIAASQTPGSVAPMGATVGGQGIQGTQASGATAGFESMLATLFGSEVATSADPAVSSTGPGASVKSGSKVSIGDKAATGDAKPKVKTAANDATSTAGTPDLSQLIVVASANLPTAATQIPVVKTSDGQDGAGTAIGSQGKTAIPTGLVPVTGATVDTNAGPNNKVDTAATPVLSGPAATSAGQAATNASAVVTFEGPSAKGDNAPAGLQVSPKADPPVAAQVPPASLTATAATAAQTPTNSSPPQGAVAGTAPAPVAPAMVATEALTNPPPAPPTGPVGAKDVASKDKVQGPKGTPRLDVNLVNTAPGSAGAPSVKASDTQQPLSDTPSKGLIEDPAAHEPAVGAQDGASGPTQTPTDQAATSSTMPPTAMVQAAAVAARGSPQTVANLTAQIVKKLDGRSTQFDVQLDPIGLGKVDVHIAIDADGRMSAAMSFDNPQAAAELKSRAGELHQAMAQAGFDLTGGMSFDVGSDSGQGGQAQNQQSETGAALRGRALQAVFGTTAEASPPPQLPLRRNSPSGVDIRI